MAIDGLVIDNYNNLTDKPIINQDLDGTFTAAANTYYKHTGTTGATYTQGVVYFYDGTDFVAITGGGSGGGGVSDVKVNGTSVVADGVANIPAASESTDGVVTTGAQTLKGTKTIVPSAAGANQQVLLKLKPLIPASGRAYAALELFGITSSGNEYPFKIGMTEINTLTFRHNIAYSASSFVFSNYSQQSFTININSAGKIIMLENTATGQMRIYGQNPSGNPYWIETYTPVYSGTMMSKPTSYSSGTSGSLTITTAGEYEFYFVDSTGVRINIGSINIAASTASATGITTDYNQAYKLEVSAAGLVTLYNIVIGTSSTATTDTLYYRRKGI